ncbi:hypothetical protein OHS18_05940 [Amycolatopsis sp. NBC_00355]|uniref:hypothetical protein n=1 Tax=Amycolatopsis sp. NBC_00355 TaxID=2975957 RepID=UPI002E2544EC
MAEERPPFPPLLAGRWVPSLHDDDIAALVGAYERGRGELAARPPGSASDTAGRDATAESMLGTLAVLHGLASVTFEQLCRVTVLLGPAVHEFGAWPRPPGGEGGRARAVRSIIVVGAEARLRSKLAEHATGFLVRAGGGVRVPRPGPRARIRRRRLDELDLALGETLGTGLATFLVTTTGWAERYASIIDEINACYVAVRAHARERPGDVVAGPATG